uniref:Uncharacterized protein n=1 Tax=Romanomermis culicivorax TaxID=13658 RepID=A0A915JA40_ROMCU
MDGDETDEALETDSDRSGILDFLSKKKEKKTHGKLSTFIRFSLGFTSAGLIYSFLVGPERKVWIQSSPDLLNF